MAVCARMLALTLSPRADMTAAVGPMNWGEEGGEIDEGEGEMGGWGEED